LLKLLLLLLEEGEGVLRCNGEGVLRERGDGVIPTVVLMRFEFVFREICGEVSGVDLLIEIVFVDVGLLIVVDIIIIDGELFYDKILNEDPNHLILLNNHDDVNENMRLYLDY
jgi:hypothetical protein